MDSSQSAQVVSITDTFIKEIRKRKDVRFENEKIQASARLHLIRDLFSEIDMHMPSSP